MVEPNQAPVQPMPAQTQQQNPTTQTVVPGETAPVQKPDGKSINLKKIIVVIVLTLVILAVISIGAFYFFSKTAPTKESVITVEPTPTPFEEEIVIEDQSDLENINEVLSKTDATLDNELNQLEKDSNF